MQPEAQRVIAQNKKAFHDYFVDSSLETGIELCGTEVKSIRAGRVNLKDAYCQIKVGEMYVCGMHISAYEKGNIFNRDPLRPRRLLLHKSEIRRLFGLVGRQGYSIIPLKMYFSGKWVKLEIGLCKGKKLYDKRDSEAKKAAQRDAARAVKTR